MKKLFWMIGIVFFFAGAACLVYGVSFMEPTLGIYPVMAGLCLTILGALILLAMFAHSDVERQRKHV